MMNEKDRSAEAEEKLLDEQPAETADTSAQEASRARRRRILVCILIVFLLLDAVAAVTLFSVIRRDRQESEDVRDAQAQKVGVTQEMTEEEREELVAIAVGQAHSYVSLRSEMDVQDGAAQIYLANDKQSSCAVEVELMLMESRETVLRTGVVEPGWYLESAPLNAQLEPGEYYCLAHCLFYTMDDNAYLGTTARHVLLRVH